MCNIEKDRGRQREENKQSERGGVFKSKLMLHLSGAKCFEGIYVGVCTCVLLTYFVLL